MSRERRITVAGLNIVAHPHSPDIYCRLIQTAFRLKKPVPVHGEQSLLMSSCDLPREEKTDLIKGAIARFTDLSPDLSWFNLGKLDKADDEELKSISIPEGLKPNFHPFWFVFDPVSHTLVFEQKLSSFAISPNIVAKYFASLFSDQIMVGKFGHIHSSVISDHGELEKMLSAPHLREVRILVNRPNPDGLDSYDAQFE